MRTVTGFFIWENFQVQNRKEAENRLRIKSYLLKIKNAWLREPQPTSYYEFRDFPDFFVYFFATLFSMALIISNAMSFPVAPSIPSKPGDELTSNNSGPFAERIISTPATVNPIAFAA